MRIEILVFSLLIPGLTWGAPHSASKVIIQVDLNAHTLRVEKVTANNRFHLDGPTLPVLKDSFHAGVYRPTRLFQRFRSVNGNTYLENVIFFDGSHTIRTSRLYDQLRDAGLPVTGSIILEPDFGMVLFDAVARYGKNNTTIILKR